MDKNLIDLNRNFPALRDKLAVSIVTRLRSAKEQTRVQQERDAVLSRLYDSVTGKGAKRQKQVNAHLTQGLDDAMTWLTEITESVEIGHRAILQVREGVEELQGQAAEIADAVGDLQVSVKELNRALGRLSERLDSRISELEDRIDELDYRNKAQKQLERIIERWGDQYEAWLPPGQRCYSALEQMWWGDIGYYCVRFPGAEADRLLEDVHYRLLKQIIADTKVTNTERCPRAFWFELQDGMIQDDESKAMADDAVTLLSDWATLEQAPFVYAAAHLPDPNQEIRLLPHLISAQRLVTAMEREVFEKEVA